MRRVVLGIFSILALVSAAHAAEPPEAAPRRPTAISTPDFLRQAAATHKFAIASSQLALRKSQSDVVRGFAQQLVLDYSAAAMKFSQAVADAKLTSPRDALDAGHKEMLDGLNHTPPGKKLSRAYLDTLDKALREDLAVFQAYAQGGDTERLKLFAEDMAAAMRGHLEQLGKLRQ